MTGVEAPFALPWIVLAAAWLCLALLVVALHRLVQPWLGRLEAAQRSTLLLALCLVPMVVAVLVAVLAFAPHIGGVLVDEHCHADVGCVAHVPILHTTTARAGLLGAGLLVATGGLLWSIGSRLRRSVLFARTLSSLAERADREPFKTVESRERFAYCVGLLRPQILVSRGVLELPEPQRNAILAHELAHASRRDNLRRWLAGVSLWPLPRRASGRLLGDLAQANEQACDAAAGGVHGSAPLAAALASLTEGERSPPATDTARRLLALDGQRGAPIRPALLLATILALYLIFALAALDAAHHGSELVLGWLA